ncbi:MAG: hypothetical protein IPP88_05140 [Betaproteobacteria bacterium]|nr:hypothetical protein [Betaproteobacteria bacterium]
MLYTSPARKPIVAVALTPAPLTFVSDTVTRRLSGTPGSVATISLPPGIASTLAMVPEAVSTALTVPVEQQCWTGVDPVPGCATNAVMTLPAAKHLTIYRHRF